MSKPDSIEEITVEDVEKLNSKGWNQLNQDAKEYNLGRAKRKINGQFSRRQSRFSTIQGDQVDAAILLAGHIFELAEGGEAQSTNSQGGSVSYNTVTGEVFESLSETRYGRELLSDYLRDRQSMGIVRTY